MNQMQEHVLRALHCSIIGWCDNVPRLLG